MDGHGRDSVPVWAGRQETQVAEAKAETVRPEGGVIACLPGIAVAVRSGGNGVLDGSVLCYTVVL